MAFSPHWDKAIDRLNDVYNLALGSLAISGGCFVADIVGLIGSSGVLIGLGVLVLLNGSFFLNARHELSEASRRDEAERIAAGAALAASLRKNNPTDGANSN